MQIGDTVRIIGPDWNGDVSKFGEVFLVDMQSATLGFSAPNFPWYRESSLELASKPKTFQIGQKVRIIGPDVTCQVTDQIGKEFVIQDASKKPGMWPIWYSRVGVACYPASSLELVEEELAIGDEVEIIGKNVHKNSYSEGRKIKIGQIIIDEKYGTLYSAPGECGYPASSLRKIEPKTGDLKLSVKLDTSEFSKGIEKIQDRLWKIQVEQRLSAIEKGNEELWQKIEDLNEWADEKDDQIRFIEKWQMEHDLEKSSRLPKGFKLESPVISKILDEQEIKVGDWVQVIGPSVTGICGYIGKVFQVHVINPDGGCKAFDFSYNPSSWIYKPSSLHKLSPEEILERLNQVSA